MHVYTYICIDTCSGISVPEGYNPETAILQEQMKKIEKEAQAKREKEEEAAKKAEVRCVCVFHVRF